MADEAPPIIEESKQESKKDPGGRPAYDDDWYKKRLDEMEPILKLGNSLGYAAEKTGNQHHRTTLYEKYRVGGWFSDKVDALRSVPGEIANNIGVKLLNKINDKITNELPITHDDIELFKFMGQFHRSSQPFFVSRVETAEGVPVADILGEIDNDADTGHDRVADEATRQMVEADPPIQDQGQTGPVGDVQAEPNPDQAPSPVEGTQTPANPQA